MAELIELNNIDHRLFLFSLIPALSGQCILYYISRRKKTQYLVFAIFLFAHIVDSPLFYRDSFTTTMSSSLKTDPSLGQAGLFFPASTAFS